MSCFHSFDLQDEFNKNGYLRRKADDRTEREGDFGDGTYLVDRVNPQLPLAQENEYFEELLDWEDAATRSLAEILGDRYQPIRNLALATDEEVGSALVALLDALEDIGQLIYFADHLSDRRLYCVLKRFVEETEIKDTKKKAPCPWYFCFFTETGPLEENDYSVYLTYYASAMERLYWKDSHPLTWLPEKLEAPHQRLATTRPRPFLLTGPNLFDC